MYFMAKTNQEKELHLRAQYSIDLGPHEPYDPYKGPQRKSLARNPAFPR